MLSKRLRRLLLLIVAPLIAIAGITLFLKPKISPSSLIPYAGVPSSQPSQAFSVRVNGQNIFVEKYGTISFARFAFSHSANVAVTVCEPVKTFTLSPKSYNIPATISDRTISFILDNPQRIVLRNVNSLPEELFLLADAPESTPPAIGGVGVTNALTQNGIDNANANNSAPGINQAINRISAAGGGTLFFPAGLYNIQSSINMKSNVTVYLSPGAVLQVAAHYNCCFANQGVVNFIDVNNAKLTGRGIINGNAVNIPQSNLDFHMIYTENASNIEIDDVLLLDQGVTGIRLVDARDSAVRNVKIIANNPSTESDGIDFDSAQSILVDNAFIYTSDDNTSQGGGTGVRKTVKDQHDLTIQNSVFYNQRTGAAFKIGTQTPQNTINTITYSNIDIVSCIQGAAFYPSFGANIENISFTNIRAETVKDRFLEFHAVVPTWNPNWNGRLGYIHDVTFKDVSVESPGTRRSDFLGFSPVRDVRGITFTNFRVGGKPALDASSARLTLNAFVSNVAFNP